MTEANSTTEQTSTKPNCWHCVHRGTVPGSAHSSCLHPATKATRSEPFMQLAGMVGKRGGPELAAMASQFGKGPESAARQLNIKGAAQGVRMGWFVWPVNFDPTWLESCNGFEAKATGGAE